MNNLIYKAYQNLLIDGSLVKEMLKSAFMQRRNIMDAYGYLPGLSPKGWSDIDVKYFSFLYKYGDDELNEIMVHSER